MKRNLLLTLLLTILGLPSLHAEDFYLRGDIDGTSWDSNNAHFQRSADGNTFILKWKLNKGKEFKFYEAESKKWYTLSAQSNNTYYVYPPQDGENNWKDYTLNEGGEKNNTRQSNNTDFDGTIIIKKNNSEYKVIFNRIVDVNMKYSLGGQEWKNIDMYADKNGNRNVYSALINIPAKTDLYVTFFDGNYNGWEGNAGVKRYGPPTDGTSLDMGKKGEVKASENCWKISNAQGLYAVSFNYNTMEITFTKQDDVKENAANYVYFNGGADYAHNNKWKDTEGEHRLFAYFWYSDFEYSMRPMTLMPIGKGQDDVDTYMFYTDVPTDRTYTSVSFVSTFGYQPKTIENHCVVYNGKDVTSKSNWNKYIYGPDSDDKAAYSYVTYERYKQLRANKGKDGIVFCGDNITLTDNTTNSRSQVLGSNGFSNRSTATAQKDDDGLYVCKLKVKSSSQYKVSYINPNTLRDEVKEPDDSQRWWATFNLGIIGPDDTRYMLNGNSVASTSKHIVTESNASNGKCYYVYGNTINYNHYNQYNWVLREENPSASNIDAKAQGKELSSEKTLYFVVDTKYNTTALVPFDPQPEFESSNTILQHVNIEKLNESIKNSEALGEATYHLATLISANATLNPISDDNASKKQYSTVFKMNYTTDKQDFDLGSYEAALDEGATLEDLPIIIDSRNNSLTVRALYTDHNNFGSTVNNESNMLKFRSRPAGTSLPDVGVYMDALQVKNIKAVAHNIKEDTEGVDYNMLDAAVGITYSFPDDNPYTHDVSEGEATSAVVYPTLTINGKREDEYGIMDASHPYLSVKGEDYLSDTYGYSFPDDNDGKSNWSTESAMALSTNGETNYTEGFFPIHISDVCKFDEMKEGKVNMAINGTLTACYPFLIRKVSQAKAVSLKKAHAAPHTPAPIELNDYDLAVVEYDQPFNIQLSRENLSGVEDVAVEDGEGVLYNLQGVRVMEAAPAPGVYIRRAADGSASKVIVR